MIRYVIHGEVYHHQPKTDGWLIHATYTHQTDDGIVPVAFPVFWAGAAPPQEGDRITVSVEWQPATQTLHGNDR